MRWTEPGGVLPRRHARVWLDPATWRSCLVGGPDDERAETIHAWIIRGRAVVACRRAPAAPAACGLGVALPPVDGKRRIAFAVDPRAILRVAAPLHLAEVIDTAPTEWQAALHDLQDRGERVGVGFHVYGSLAWQAISGERYVARHSDVDLLWTADSTDRIDRILCLLSAWEADSGLRADGELVLPGGDGVAWRELIRRPVRVLVKHQDRVSLQSWPMVRQAPFAGSGAA